MDDPLGIPDDDAPTIPPQRAEGADSSGTPAADVPSPDSAATSIGGYRLDRVIGEGGMGTVHLAEQASPRRRVALKVIRPGLADADMLRRFDIEAEILGRLDHPGIATIHEAGTFDAGFGPQPFFAMEYVAGSPLTSFAKRKALGTRDRLELIARIADAIQHAHQKGVIHRDLKPGNILVTEAGQPKVLDFGVARATDGDLQQVTMQTDVGQLVGTLPYMSPEQASADPAALDTRSDVYALGVVAYELLAGHRPHDLKGAAVHEAVRRICEDDPAPLSSVDRTLRGDVAIIVGTAMAREKDRRYQTAGDLAADIRRYLGSEPITARAPSTVYRMRRFAARNTAAVAGIVAASIALVAGTIVASSFAIGEAAERQRAESEREVTDAINTFLDRRLLGAVAPEQEGHDVLVRDMLDAAAAALDDEPPGNVRVEAALRLIIGRTYTSLGLDAESERHLVRARDLATQIHGADTLETVEVEEALAFSLMRTARFDEAAELVRHGVEVRTATLGADDPLTLRLQGDLAMFEALAGGELSAGMSPMLLDMMRAARGRSESREQMQARWVAVLAEIDRLERSGDRAAARAALEREAEPFLATPLIRGRMPYALASYARMLADDGLPDAADAVCAYALRLAGELLPLDHPHALHAEFAAAELAIARRRETEAFEHIDRYIEGKRRSLGPEHPDTLGGAYHRAWMHHQIGRLADAEAGYASALVALQEHLGDGHWTTRMTMYRFGQLLDEAGRWPEAEAMLTAELDATRRADGDDGADTLVSIENLARAYVRRGAWDRAAVLADELAGHVASGAPEDRLRAAELCAEVHAGWHVAEPQGGHGDDADRWAAERDRLRDEAAD